MKKLENRHKNGFHVINRYQPLVSAFPAH